MVITVVFANPHYFQMFYLKVIQIGLAIFQTLSNMYQAMLEEAYGSENKASHQKRIAIKT